MRSIRALAVAAGAAMALGAVPAAWAGTAHVSGLTVYFSAGAAEGNDVRVSRVSNTDAVEVTDAGAAITAGAGCSPVDSHTVRCSDPWGGSLLNGRFELGDESDALRIADGWDYLVALGAAGDDRMRAPVGNIGTFLYGESGDDALTVADDLFARVFGGGFPIAEVDGGQGDDRLRARTANGETNLRGAAGDDVLDARDLPAQEDFLECGDGDDVAVADGADTARPDCETVRVDVLP